MFYLEDLDLDNNRLKEDTLKNIKNFNKNCELIVVMVKAQWCGHCTNTTPKFEKASETINNDKIAFCFADITGERESEKALKDLVGKFFKDFRGFPNITCFSLNTGKELAKYDGDRSVESLKQYAIQQLQQC
jgi:thiol-disulfide isomerase/thioredoxin